jgi:hypothetical protein
MLPIAVRSRILGRNSLACVCTLVSVRPGQGNFRTTIGQLLDNYTQTLSKSCESIATRAWKLRSPAAVS